MTHLTTLTGNLDSAHKGERGTVWLTDSQTATSRGLAGLLVVTTGEQRLAWRELSAAEARTLGNALLFLAEQADAEAAEDDALRDQGAHEVAVARS